MDKKSFRTRRFENSDMDGIIQLFELAFGGRFSREWWTWKYRLNPAGFWGEKGDIWIAEKGEEVIGHWALIPEKMKIGQETVTVAQAVDAATHPEYRRLGIFRTLVKKVCSDAGNRYGFIFGHPHKIIHKAYLRLGWKDFPLCEFYKFLNYDRPFRSLFTRDFLVWSGKVAFRALGLAKRLSLSICLKKYRGTTVEIRKVEQFPDEIDDFWGKARSEFETVLERTATFLNWRFSKYFGNYNIYLARSVENGGITAYMILRETKTENIENVLDIVDLNALPEEDKCMLDLIEMAIAIAKEKGLDIVHCRIPRWHRYANLLYKLGFISINRMLLLMKMYEPRLIFYQSTEKGKTPKMCEWFYTLTDTDDA